MRITIRLVLVMFVFALIFLSFLGCNTAKPPLSIVSTYPENGTINVPMESNISLVIKFSEPISQEVTAKAITITPSTPYDITWEEEQTLMRVGSLDLLPNSSYKVILSTVTEAADGEKLLDSYTFSFETGLKPQICGVD